MVIDSTLCEDTNNPESGWGSNCLSKEVISQGIRLDVEHIDELQSLQGLLDWLFDSHDWRIPDYQCESCNKVGFCTTSISASNIVEVLIVQLEIFRYTMNNRSRKLIPNLRIVDTVTLFEKLNIQGIMWHHGPNITSMAGH